MVLPAACEYIIEGLNRANSLPYQYREYLVSHRKFVPDETFIPTLVHTRFAKTAPKVEDESVFAKLASTPEIHNGPSIRFERWENTPGLDRIYVADPGSKLLNTMQPCIAASKYSGVDQAREWGPYYIGMYDLRAIRESGALFARKVSPAADANILEILPAENPGAILRVSWPPRAQYGCIGAQLSKRKAGAMAQKKSAKKIPRTPAFSGP